MTTGQNDVDHCDQELEIDHVPVRGTRLINEVYKRADVAVVKQACFEKSSSTRMLKSEVWIDYYETFAPVARLDTIRLLVHWLFKGSGKYISSIYLSSLGFERRISEPTLHVKKEGDETLLIVSLYVDGLLVFGGNDAMLTDFKDKMKIQPVTQKGFALKILIRFSMQNCKETSTPVAVGEKLSSQGDFEKVNESTYMSLVGCLLYLTVTRPNIMFTVSLLSRFMHCYNVNHFQAAKRILRYIKGTLSFGVMFTKADSMKLLGFADSDWVGSIDDIKSTSGYLFTLGSSFFVGVQINSPLLLNQQLELNMLQQLQLLIKQSS
ncbi:hypothetical protein EPI10_006062 [Gossypium australe]|uniref:Uncharacterized protein n=1 Tax=Gossypium australe TaxID=47621 RepID=A0A5B6WPX9_9ROSI|nr:hypothetical protein EPI10_006062 [Gossypium australe]